MTPVPVGAGTIQAVPAIAGFAPECVLRSTMS